MLRNYFVIALRTLRRHPGYTFINVTGLAVGVACCLLILLYVRDERSYDTFHEDADDIYRIVSDWGGFSIPSTNPPTLRNLEADYPEFVIAPILWSGGLVARDDVAFSERFHFTRPAFFEVFSFELLRGNPDRALTEPFTVLLTPATAQKYFGEADPIGQTLRIDNQYDAEVTGIVAEPPPNSHFTYQFLISWATLDAAFDYSNSDNWGNNAIYTYLRLPPGTDPATLEAQLPGFIERHAGARWNGSELSLQPLTDIHLRSHHNMELGTNSQVAYIYIFSAIALFILVIACVNFMNLATARSAERAKEVGVRKVMGADRWQLVRQFLAESVVVAAGALVLAVVLTALALPAFRVLAQKPIYLDVLADGGVLLAFVGLTLLVGIGAGSYPAFFLSAFKPITVLKGGTMNNAAAGGGLLRKGLVVFQFAISIVFIAATLVVYHQLSYLRSATLGFDQERVVVVDANDEQITSQFAPFRQALLSQPGVQAVTIASEGLPSELLNGTGTRLDGVGGEDQDLDVPTRTVSVGFDFFETLGVEMVAGRAFSRDFPSDSAAYVLNATAARMLAEKFPEQLGTPEEAIGRMLDSRIGAAPLIGIVEDFNMATLHEAIEPVVFFILPDWYDHYLVRLAPGEVTATMAGLEATWASVNPDWPFTYQFADAAFDAQYRSEARLGQIFTTFTLLALFIACLGLFGLASFTATRRTKEIGVRKVMGATVPQIVQLLSKEFTVLVVWALAVAVPVAYLLMDAWLEGFAYRVGIAWWVFAVAGGAALLIAWLTVSYQSIRTALSNPVEALRYE